MSDLNDQELQSNDNWAFPMLRMVLIGASLELFIAAAATILIHSRLIPDVSQPIVDYFVYGGIVAAVLAGISSLLYLWIRPGLIKGQDT